MARMKRLMDSVQYTGPISIAGDCTKVRACLTFSTDFGSHILGSTLPLEQVEVDEPEDIDRVIAFIKRKSAQATQTRAIIAKVCILHFTCLRRILLISVIQFRFLYQIFHPLKVISFAADGAASELLAQEMMDQEDSDKYPPLSPLTEEKPNTITSSTERTQLAWALVL